MYTESFLPAVRLSNKLYCVLTCCILVQDPGTGLPG